MSESLFEVGDPVISKFYGKGVVADIDLNHPFPVLVAFKGICTCRFTTKGGYLLEICKPDRDIKHIGESNGRV